MKLKNLFLIFAIVSLLFGLTLLFFPATLLDYYGVSPADALETMLMRFLGGFTFSLGLMIWFARDAEASKARDAIVLGLAIGNAISAILSIWAAQTGMFNALIWIEAALFALFAVGFTLRGRASMSSN
jgi:hypothetical protein